MKLRGTPTYGGVTYYKLIGAAFQGSSAEAGDAIVEHGGNAQRDALLRGVDRSQAMSARAGSKITFVRVANPDTTREVEIAYEPRPENQASEVEPAGTPR
jgi:hypothetical protein